MKHFLNYLTYMNYLIAYNLLKIFRLNSKKNGFLSEFFISRAVTFAEISSIITFGVELLLVFRLILKDVLENIDFFYQWFFCSLISYLMVEFLVSKNDYFTKIFIKNQNKKSTIKGFFIVTFFCLIPITILLFIQFW